MFKVMEKCYVEHCIDGSMAKLVYGILEDSNGYPKFLFYEKGQWIYHSVKDYVPYGNE